MSRASDRNRWQHMQPATRVLGSKAAEAAKTDLGIRQALEEAREVWANNIYVAVVTRDPAGVVNCISVHRHDRSALRDWRHLQYIKNDIAGPEADAFERFPPESQLVDTANEAWIWVLPEPIQPGLLGGRRVIGTPEEARRVGAVQRPREEDLTWPE